MGKKRIELLLFFTWSLWLSLEFLLGPYSHVRIFDAGDSLLPSLIGAKLQFQKYGINYFADYMASGVDGASQFLIPFSNLNSTLFTLFPGWLAYGILMFTQRFLASYFTFRLFRDILKLDILPSILGGLLYSLFNLSFNSFTLYHLLGVPAIPFIIYCLHRLLERKKINNFYFLGFGALVGYSNYFIYFTPYVIPLIILWFTFVNLDFNKKILLSLVIFSAGVLVVEFQTIIAVYLNSRFSQRLSFQFPNFSVQLQAVFSLIRGVFTENIISILLIIVSFKINPKLNLLSKKLIFLTLLITLATVILKFIQPLVFANIEVLKSFTFDRFQLILPFMFTTSAVVCLNYSIRNRNFSRYFLFFIVFVILISASVKIKIETVKNYAPYRNLYLHPDLMNLENRVKNEMFRVATINAGGIRPSYAIAYFLPTVDGYLTLYPKSYQNFWSRVVAKRIENDPLRFWDINYWGNKIYLWGPQGFDQMDSIGFDNYYDLHLLSVANVKYILSTKPINDPNLTQLPSTYREQFKDWPSLKLLSKFKRFVNGSFYGPPIYIYENSKALPRFLILNEKSPEFMAWMRAEFSEEERTPAFRTEESLKNLSGILSSSVEVKRYRPDKIEISINDVKDPSVLVAAINYYPYWQATVNGSKSQVKTFQGTFLQVEIPIGRVDVVLEYKPPYAIPFR